MQNLTFTKFDFLEFQKWIELDLSGITWQGRYEEEFNLFWNQFFVPGSDLKSLMQKFNYAEREVKIGPLLTWFNWLKEKFVDFVFIHKNISLKELSSETNISLPHLAKMIRDYFLDFYPHLEDQLNEFLQIGSTAHKNSYITFSDLNDKLQLSGKLKGIHSEEILNSLEVTLYEDFKNFLDKLQNLHKDPLRTKILKPVKKVRFKFHYFRDITVLFIVGILSIWGVKSFNLWYEKYLEQKIAVYEPQFKWSNKGISFFSKDQVPDENFNLDIEDFDKASASRKPVSEETEEVYEEETDVSLMSLGSLPKDFDVANLEQSDYEEMVKIGNRDTRFGNKMVYRVIMKSVDPLQSKKTLNDLIDKFEVTQVDNVRPGTLVPGGVYYNVFVPRNNLKDFLANVMEMDEATLYETRTRRSNPPGQHRVFIWIKTF